MHIVNNCSHYSPTFNCCFCVWILFFYQQTERGAPLLRVYVKLVWFFFYLCASFSMCTSAKCRTIFETTTMEHAYSHSHSSFVRVLSLLWCTFCQFASVINVSKSSRLHHCRLIFLPSFSMILVLWFLSVVCEFFVYIREYKYNFFFQIE